MSMKKIFMGLIVCQIVLSGLIHAKTLDCSERFTPIGMGDRVIFIPYTTDKCKIGTIVNKIKKYVETQGKSAALTLEDYLSLDISNLTSSSLSEKHIEKLNSKLLEIEGSTLENVSVAQQIIGQLFMDILAIENYNTPKISYPELTNKALSEREMQKLERSIYARSTTNMPTAYGFDYPIGNRGYDSNGNKISLDEQIRDECVANNLGSTDCSNYNKQRNEQYNLGINIFDDNDRWSGDGKQGWYNYNDVGAFGRGAGQKGLHSGEDWNKRNGDAGEEVYAIADGIIEEISSVGNTIANRGWKIIIKHKLPNNSNVYSIYLHVTIDANDNRVLTNTHEEDFSFQEGDIVRKGNIIARIATGMTAAGVGTHLHFEMRTKFTSGNTLYANANINGYYTQDETTKETMKDTEVNTAFSIMKSDGIIDPSDFIDDHRVISKFDGSGSLINYTDKVTWGASRDEARMHPHTNMASSVSFQWLYNKNDCHHIDIHTDRVIEGGVTVSSKNYLDRISSKTYIVNDLPTGDSAEHSGFSVETSKQNPLNDEDKWNTVMVTSNQPIDDMTRVFAYCRKSTDILNLAGRVGIDNRMIPIDEYQWTGNGSLISQTSNGIQNTGITIDNISVPKNTKSFTAVQVYAKKDTCEKIKLINGYSSSTEATTVHDVQFKEWSHSDWTTQGCISLPCSIYADGYYIFKILSNENTISKLNIQAQCVK